VIREKRSAAISLEWIDRTTISRRKVQESFGVFSFGQFMVTKKAPHRRSESNAERELEKIGPTILRQGVKTTGLPVFQVPLEG